MLVWTELTHDTLTKIADDLGIVAEVALDGGRRGAAGSRFHVRLGLRDETFRATRNDRRINAVCWHGHRDWMRGLFAADPSARLKSVIADYHGAEDFENTHGETGELNIGSQARPEYARNACRCGS